jgi:hypothetical protein
MIFLYGALAGFVGGWAASFAARLLAPAYKPEPGEWIVLADVDPSTLMRAVRDATQATRVTLTRYRDYGWRLSVWHELPTSQPAPAQPEGSVKG